MLEISLFFDFRCLSASVYLSSSAIPCIDIFAGYELELHKMLQVYESSVSATFSLFSSFSAHGRIIQLMEGKYIWTPSHTVAAGGAADILRRDRDTKHIS